MHASQPGPTPAGPPKPIGRLPDVWNTTVQDLEAAYPCDGLLPEADAALIRAIDIDAPVPVCFRWLCQLRAAPYSYDWIDNRGRQSPPRLIPGLESLARGQRVMSIFELVDFQPDRHLTLRMRTPSAVSLFGEVVCSYLVQKRSSERSRLVVKMLVRYPTRPPWSAVRWLLPWGDLVMMRKQLRTLKRYAEGSTA